MSSYDRYDNGRPERTSSSTRYYDERRYQRDPRYVESRDSEVKPSISRDLVPRGREDSDLSVEEIDRDFPPPSYSRDVYREYDGDRYARSSRQHGHYRGHDDHNYDLDYDRDYDRREGKQNKSIAHYEEDKKRRRMLSKQEKIIAAVIGGALAVGGKELYDRREARNEGHDVNRNTLSSAALGAAGALAAYQGADFYNKRATKEDRKSLVHNGRYGRSGDAYSDDDSDEDPREKKSRKNFLENALASAGLGGAVKALTVGGGGVDDKRSDTRSRRGDSRSRSRSRSDSQSRDAKGGTANKVQKAAMASLIAGATEAFRVAREPGGWKGEKAKRVITAAAGAATIDAAQDDKHSKLGIAESVIGGLLGNRIVNGSRRNIEEDKQTGRSRSRSRARSDGGGNSGVTGLAALATAGLGAIGAKKIANNYERSRSRRRRSADSYDSRTRSPDRSRRSRSRSVVDTARRSLAKLGIGNGPDAMDRDEAPRENPSSSRHHSHRDSGDDYDNYSSDRYRYGDHDRDRDYNRGYGRDGKSEQRDHHDRTRSGSGSRRNKGRGSDSDSDLGSSSEDEKKAKKMKGKQIVITGLAAVATIHAAHNVYQSMEKRHARRKAVQEGRLSAEEAKKMKQRALLQDAASVGIAALGIKGAISEMKEVREVSHEMKQWQEEKARRHERRLQRQRKAPSGATSNANAGPVRGDEQSDNRLVRIPSYHDYDYDDSDSYSALLEPVETLASAHSPRQSHLP